VSQPPPLGEGLFAEVVAALLDFEKAPGRYAVALQRPEVVFNHLRNVLQIAVGRAPESAAMPPGRVSMAQRAARFFVRTVMLRPGSDHFTLLGLTQGFEPDELRDHYRMMIRLTHPDFTASGEVWPADAASRINIANDVLSSPVKRGEYVRRTAASAMAAPASARPLRRMPSVRRIAAQRAAARAFRSRAAMAGLLGIAALVAVGGALLLRSGPDDSSLTVAARSPARSASGVAVGSPTEPLPGDRASAPAPGLPDLVAPDLTEPVPTAPASLPSDPAPPAPRPEPVAVAAAATPPPAPRPRRVRPTPTETPYPAATAVSSAQPSFQPPAQIAQPAQPAPAAPPAPALPPATPATVVTLAAAPEPARAAAPAETPTPIAAAAPSPAAPPAPPAPEPIVSGLALTDVQPTLTRVVESLQTGRGPAVVRWVDPALRNSAANQRFVNSYHFAIGGRRIVQLQRADFTARDQPGELVVTGQIELMLEDAQGSMAPRKLQVRAHFTPRDGKPVLTQLVNIPIKRNP
jgi:hypothetical protein